MADSIDNHGWSSHKNTKFKSKFKSPISANNMIDWESDLAEIGDLSPNLDSCPGAQGWSCWNISVFWINSPIAATWLVDKLTYVNTQT